MWAAIVQRLLSNGWDIMAVELHDGAAWHLAAGRGSDLVFVNVQLASDSIALPMPDDFSVRKLMAESSAAKAMPLICHVCGLGNMNVVAGVDLQTIAMTPALKFSFVRFPGGEIWDSTAPINVGKVECSQWEIFQQAVRIVIDSTRAAGETVLSWTANPNRVPHIVIRNDKHDCFVLVNATRYLHSPQPIESRKIGALLNMARSSRAACAIAEVSLASALDEFDGHTICPIYRPLPMIAKFEGLKILTSLDTTEPVTPHAFH